MDDKKILEEIIVKYGNSIDLTGTSYGLMSYKMWLFASAALCALEHNRPSDSIGMYGLALEFLHQMKEMDLRTVHSNAQREDILKDLRTIKDITEKVPLRFPEG